LIDTSKAIAVTEGNQRRVTSWDGLGPGEHGGAYNRFSREVHQFFNTLDHLPHTFQNFGRSDTRGRPGGADTAGGISGVLARLCQSTVGYCSRHSA
jgi:hypothetical protein